MTGGMKRRRKNKGNLDECGNGKAQSTLCTL